MQTPYTDTHTHLYLEAFNDDRSAMVTRALEAGVTRMFLPNIDLESVEGMLQLCAEFPKNCYPMMGLHPTSVKEDSKSVLSKMELELNNGSFIAVGEIGIDLYWDKTFLQEQEEAFRTQVGWAKELGLPVVIHSRESFVEIFRILDEEKDERLQGVFHSFTGNEAELEKALSYGFYIGINGIVTFKNSGLGEVAKQIPTERLLLETDAPFLAPVPHRGKRNESSYVTSVAAKLAELFSMSPQKIAELTTKNALNLFSTVS